MQRLLALSGGLLVLLAGFVFLRTRGMSRDASRGQLDLDADTVAKLPDRIHLEPLAAKEPLPAHLVEPARELCTQGFEDAGAFRVGGIEGLTVRLLAHRAQSMYATLWHYQPAGEWLDISTHYPGGHICTFTNLSGRGLAGRPGHTIVRVAGMTTLDLFLRHVAERPMGVFRPVSPA